MGVFIEDLEDEEKYLKINWWNWRSTIEIIRASGLLDDERLELMGYNGGSTKITQTEARKIAEFLEEKVMSQIHPDERVFYDFSITNKPDDGTFHRKDLAQNYSASYKWLHEFSNSLKQCKGFTVI